MKALKSGLAVTLTLFASATQAQNVIRHPSKPAGIILQSVTVKSGATVLYISGQLASPLPSATATAAPNRPAAAFGNTKTQTISALRKIEAILAQQNYRIEDVIKLTFFVVGDPELGGKLDVAGMNEGFSEFFGSAANPSTVARSAVQVAALVSPGNLIEIEAIAAK